MSDMRSRSQQQTMNQRNGMRRMRGRSLIRVSGGVLHFFGVLAMILGLFLPLTGVGQALAAPTRIDTLSREPSQDIGSSAFSQVAAIGDFQGQFGCNSFDINCPSTQLTNHNGIWTGVIAIPAGQWQWQIQAVTQDGQQITLSNQGVDQQGTLSIDEGDAGAWFSFNAARQEADAAVTPQIATLSTDLGTFALEPDNGNFSTTIQSVGGAINAELQLDGAPVGNPQVIQLNQGANEVTVDADGNLVNVQALGYATLTINRTDGSTGEPLPGGCYEVRQGGTVINRGCDTDDGAADGRLTLTFPDGLQPGTYTVAEVVAPQGAEQAPDQDVDLQLTDNTVDIVTGEPEETPTEEPAETETEVPTEEATATDEGGIQPLPGEETPTEVETETPTETPAEEQNAPGDLIVTLQDEQGNPIGGACFQLIDGDGNVVAESCDIQDANPYNGKTGFFGVPSGTYTLHESAPPEGTLAIEDQPVTIPAGGEQDVTITAPAPEETPVPTGDIVVLRQDENGNPVGGSCFELIGVDNQPLGDPVCDEDGDVADDGRIGFFDVPAGTYTLHETRTPEGYQPAQDVSITVNAGETTQQVVQSALIPTETPTEEPTEAPTEVPTEEPTETPTEAPTEEPTETPTQEPTETPTETPTQEPTETPTPEQAVPGSLIVTLQDQQGNPIGGACFELRQGDTVLGPICDADDPFPGNGNTGFFDVPSGQYTLHQTTTPEGTQPIADQPVTVPANDQDTVIVYAPAQPEPTATPTEEETATPTEEPTGTPTEEPTSPPSETEGQVVVDLPTDAASEQVCVELNTSGGIGLLNPPSGCNTESNDPAQIVISDVPAGMYTAFVTVGPDALINAEPQPVDVQGGETTQLPLQGEESQTESSIIINTTDGTNPLGGACYAVDSGDPVCDQENTGTVAIHNVPTGEHTVAQTTAPAGYVLVTEAQQVDLTTNGAILTFQNVPETGSIIVTIVDDQDQPVPDTCVSIDGGDPQCDNGDSDTDPAEGSIQIDELGLGDHDVALINVAEQFEQPDSQTATVVVDTPVTISFSLVNAAPQTAGLDVTVELNDEPVAGVCVELVNAEEASLGPFCDGDDADSNPNPGVIGIDDIPLGTWSVSLAKDTDIDGGDVAKANSPSVELQAGQRADALITVPALPTTGTVRIITTNGSINLADACYDLTMSGAETISVCDNDSTDNDGTDGVIEVSEVSSGTWTITMTQAPAGYQPSNGEVMVTAGETATVEISLAAIPQPGSLKISKVDEAGNPLGGSCFELRQNGNLIQSACDDAGTGVLEITDLTAGTYQLIETRAPSSDYGLSDTQNVTIIAGEETAVTVTNVARPGRLTVITVKDSDRSQRLENACYRLDGDRTYGPFCDADDGAVDGRVSFSNVRVGEYTLVQTVSAPGFDPAANRNVTIQPGASLQITVANKATPAPEKTGTLVVIPLDEHGNPVPGGCYQVFDGDTPITGRVCDNADDVDARITFEKLPVGTFTVRELLAPSPDFVIAADQQVTIRQNETTEVEIPHTLKRGRVLVQAVNTLGQPLQGACFTLASGAAKPGCTGSTGEALFSDLAPGKNAVTQTQAPHGFKLNQTPRNITVSPGQTTVVRVVFEAAPPPDSGSVLVQKFFCPAGTGAERTQFLGSGEGNAQLARTAGCAPGVASFTLTAEDGSGNGPGAFQTGADGRFQVTVKQGVYVLTETKPKLGTTNSTRLRVGVGQMTTVIVINYVAPPKPAPTNIDVTSFTCPPSFNGTSYADFAASCTSNQAKTNNLTVRAEGAQKFKQVTGDQGKLGQTTFQNLPPGNYTVFGDKPYNIPIMYLFCGTNASDPSDVRAINGSVPVTLQGGQTITCQFFLVPEQLSKDTGAVMVQKFSCPIDKPVKGYDWANECERSTTQVAFSLGLIDKTTEKVQPVSEIQANPDGIVRFPNLAPGTYKLQEVEGNWCFAQSNSVDAKGNVVVRANELSQVWIYNCVGTSQPPNTGSGDAARLLNPEGPSGTMVMLNLAWPALALVGWFTWRQRHGNHAA